MVSCPGALPVPGWDTFVLDTLLTRSAVEKHTGLTRSTLYRYIADGRLPRPLKVGPSAVRWRASEVESWIDSRPRTDPDSED